MKQPHKRLSRICKNKKLISTFNEFVEIQTQGSNVKTQNPTGSATEENHKGSIKTPTALTHTPHKGRIGFKRTNKCIRN
jgi:hypothetical protein